MKATVESLSKKAAFDKELGLVLGADMRLADRIQVLILAALKQYEQGNPNWLTDIRGAKWSATRAAAIETYIVDHTELVWGKDKSGKKAFVWAKTPGFVYKTPEVSWYEYSKDGLEVKEVDFLKNFKSMITRMGNALENKGNNRVKPGQEDQVAKLHAQLATLKL